MNELNWLIHPLILSTKTLGTSFLLFILIGTPIAYLLAFYNGKFKAFFETIVMFPLIFPPIATGFCCFIYLDETGSSEKL